MGQGDPGGQHQAGVIHSLDWEGAMKLPRRTFLQLASGAARAAGRVADRDGANLRPDR